MFTGVFLQPLHFTLSDGRSQSCPFLWWIFFSTQPRLGLGWTPGLDHDLMCFIHAIHAFRLWKNSGIWNLEIEMHGNLEKILANVWGVDQNSDSTTFEMLEHLLDVITIWIHVWRQDVKFSLCSDPLQYASVALGSLNNWIKKVIPSRAKKLCCHEDFHHSFGIYFKQIQSKIIFTFKMAISKIIFDMESDTPVCLGIICFLQDSMFIFDFPRSFPKWNSMFGNLGWIMTGQPTPPQRTPPQK